MSPRMVFSLGKEVLSVLPNTTKNGEIIIIKELGRWEKSRFVVVGVITVS